MPIYLLLPFQFQTWRLQIRHQYFPAYRFRRITRLIALSICQDSFTQNIPVRCSFREHRSVTVHQIEPIRAGINVGFSHRMNRFRQSIQFQMGSRTIQYPNYPGFRLGFITGGIRKFISHFIFTGHQSQHFAHARECPVSIHQIKPTRAQVQILLACFHHNVPVSQNRNHRQAGIAYNHRAGHRLRSITRSIRPFIAEHVNTRFSPIHLCIRQHFSLPLHIIRPDRSFVHILIARFVQNRGSPD